MAYSHSAPSLFLLASPPSLDKGPDALIDQPVLMHNIPYDQALILTANTQKTHNVQINNDGEECPSHCFLSLSLVVYFASSSTPDHPPPRSLSLT